MQKLLFTIIFLVLSQHLYPQVNSQNYTLSVTLHNAPFKNLALRDYRDSHSLIIKGEHVGEFKWHFKIPDSIAVNSEFMELIIPDKDTAANGYRQVRFIRAHGNTNTSITNIGIQDENNYIEAKYRESKSIENENVAYILGLADSVVYGTLILDDFELLVKNDSSDITVRSQDSYYTWFDKGDNNLSYKDNLQFYINLAVKYPDSRYLMTYLSQNLLKFETRVDVKKIYEKLSDRFKKSKWARRIEQYISNFKDVKLINLNSKKAEELVQDSSKHSLLIFSASWCGPCIEEMPLLNKLHQQLKGRINFTTISMDYETKVKAFQNLLSKNEITWRTLYAYKDLDRVTDLFSIDGIPLTILVYPDGRMERMDVRDLENQKKLFSLKL
ncbi:TlpA family protein disulfide reductase [Pedobacter kyonggii]|uniref:Redoxin domain-containing protein n=1 Tax=Pedobacter kyonggii TaxID=1926871 RepID=A0A4Q9H8Z8_9SPHI|nr:TlpA disulfide reductase family protein [Pedobacter kyonggii]TBO40370.1 redoxin domain-containing protein [Pedobacter kyonggii]